MTGSFQMLKNAGILAEIAGVSATTSAALSIE